MRHRRHRQERWLHTRISEPLEDALKREARRRRLPVSLLVRNVLEGALDLVEDVVDHGLEVARRSQDLAWRVSRATANGLDDIYGWQELLLNRPTACARCGAAIGVGATAYRGLSERPAPPAFLCVTCIGRLKSPRAGTEHREGSS